MNYLRKLNWTRLPFRDQIPVWVFLILTVGTTISVLAGQKPARQYKEGHVFTLLSCLLLATAGAAAALVYRWRGNGEKTLWDRIRSPRFLWGLIAAGFLYMAVDEVACLHEKMDRGIHWVLTMKETPLTDRIDSLLIALYGVIGVTVLFVYRSEMARYRKIWPGLFVGFALLGVSVVFDLLCDDDKVFKQFFQDRGMAKTLFEWSAVVEDAAKTLAETFFLRAFLYAHALTQKAATKPVP